MADTLQDKWTRISYTDKLGRKLHPDNAGALQWGPKYRKFHTVAWREATRVLQIGSIFILNIKNHIRAGKEQYVTEWHITCLEMLGYKLLEHVHIACPSMEYGQNGKLRVPYESVIKFVLYKKE
jgi:hypothetical protein